MRNDVLHKLDGLLFRSLFLMIIGFLINVCAPKEAFASALVCNENKHCRVLRVYPFLRPYCGNSNHLFQCYTLMPRTLFLYQGNFLFSLHTSLEIPLPLWNLTLLMGKCPEIPFALGHDVH